MTDHAPHPTSNGPISESSGAPPALQCLTTHHQYLSAPLTLTSLSPSPLLQFSTWFTDAHAHVPEPEAFCLSTCTSSGMPSSRFVLLKTLDTRGFVFFTNYNSRKASELESTGHAAMAFYWREIHRQVRVVGRVERVSREETESYFRTRPVGSRVGAWASPQSEVLEGGGRERLEKRVEEVEAKFGVRSGSVDRLAGDKEDEGVDLPAPEWWGGYRIVPDEIEFWAGRPNRLHDRFQYRRKEERDEWDIVRLAP